jgi:hypothetical protein
MKDWKDILYEERKGDELTGIFKIKKIVDMKKQVKAHMLPTDDEGVVMTDVGAYNTDMIVISKLPDNLKGHERPHNHIYITSDDKIKEGDWYYHSIAKEIRQWDTSLEFIAYEICSKVIATSDESLKIKDFPELINSATRSLPNVSQSFLKEFVKSGGKKDWEVDYFPYFKGRCKDPMVCLRGCSVSDGSCRHLEYKKENTKLDLNNCIILSAVEEKMYSKDKFIESLHSYWDKMHGKGHQNISMINWIKENL